MRQLALPEPRTWGGRRKGAGRKPRGATAGVSHARRPAFRRLPAHVTLRLCAHVWSLRSRRSLRVIVRALRGGAERFGVRVVELSLQGNHAHLLVEAADEQALARAVQGLCIRVARGMNRLMGRRGRVFDDRYHARVLRTPTEVRRAREYVLRNRQHHFGEPGLDRYSSAAPGFAGVLPTPLFWLARDGGPRGRDR
jgi:REP element-mobilizing transposase RayT